MPSPFNCFCVLVYYQLTIYAQVYFSNLYSVALKLYVFGSYYDGDNEGDKHLFGFHIVQGQEARNKREQKTTLTNRNSHYCFDRYFPIHLYKNKWQLIARSISARSQRNDDDDTLDLSSQLEVSQLPEAGEGRSQDQLSQIYQLMAFIV